MKYKLIFENFQSYNQKGKLTYKIEIMSDMFERRFWTTFDGQKDIIYETLNPYLSSLDDRIFDMTSKERVRLCVVWALLCRIWKIWLLVYELQYCMYTYTVLYPIGATYAWNYGDGHLLSTRHRQLAPATIHLISCFTQYTQL